MSVCRSVRVATLGVMLMTSTAIAAQSSVATLAVTDRTGANPTVASSGSFVAVAFSAATWTLLSARSLDGGRTFSHSIPVPGSEGEGSRGWESVAVDAAGRISVLWLDHRDLIAADGAHQHNAGANASANASANATTPMAMPPASSASSVWNSPDSRTIAR